MPAEKAPTQRIPDAPAADVCRPIALGEEARALLKPELGVRAYVEALLEGGQHPDAMAVVAHWLPKREAVWWGCLCIRKAATQPDLARALAPLLAAEKWVKDPSEANRRGAENAAAAQQYQTAAAIVAMGAFWSGGSLAPPDVQQVVPPGPLLTARAVAGAVNLAAVVSAPEKAPEKYRAFADLSWSVADGASRWTAAS